MFNSSSKSIALILSALVISLGLVLIVWAWTEPTQAPPGGNVAAPLNVSGTAQTKSGALTTGGFTSTGDITYSGQLNKLDVADNFTASVRAADFKIGYSGRHGSLGRAIVDLGNDLRFNYGNDWNKASIGSNVDIYGDISKVGAICLDDGCKSSWGQVSIDLHGWSFANDYFYDDGEEVIRANDEWLRLNQAGDFSNGVYTPNFFRVDDNVEIRGALGIDNNIYDRTDSWLNVNDSVSAKGYDFTSQRDLRTGGDGRLFRYGGQASMSFDDWFRMYDSNNGNLRIEFNVDDASVRANRYYDRNNTGYYVDPASTNRMNYIRANRVRTDNVNIDGNDITFYRSTNARIRKTGNYLELIGDAQGGWRSRMWLADYTDRIYMGDGNTDLRFRGNGRINILYDRNDTSYYVNPAGTSKFNKIKARDFVYISDIALKKSIKPLENSLEKVLNLEGVSFNWKDNGEPSIGLIAQDVEKEFPRAVLTDEGGIKSVDYGKLIAPLIESIKEQQQEIKKLQAEVELLKQQLNK